MKVEREEVMFDNVVTFNKLPKKPISRFAIGSATPSVANCEYWKCGGTVLTITNFKGGQQAQTINILGDGNTTIANNANIVTNTGANKLLINNRVYRFTLWGNVWIEDV